jgi:hypothetical protein
MLMLRYKRLTFKRGLGTISDGLGHLLKYLR